MTAMVPYRCLFLCCVFALCAALLPRAVARPAVELRARTGVAVDRAVGLLDGATVRLVAKVVGDAGDDEPAGAPILNPDRGGVMGADLGAVALYRGRWFMVLGDAVSPLNDDADNFLVATGPATRDLAGGIAIDHYLNTVGSPAGPVAARALAPDPGYTIPGALFAVAWHGRAGLFAQVMEGGDFRGHDHWSVASRLARYDERARIFRPWKPGVYTWTRRDAVSSDATRLQYGFGQASFWADERAGYLYMVGAPTNRFGGVKLARIPLAAFLDPRDARPWSYDLGGGTWSAPTSDEMALDARVPWLIAPRDPLFTLDKDYDTAAYPAGTDQCAELTIAEFSVVYDPYLARFLLLTASASCKPDAFLIYAAPTITGPWTARPARVAAPYARTRSDWDVYAPYTASALLRDGGKTLYLLASTYSHYGVYLYKMDFPGPPPTPSRPPPMANWSPGCGRRPSAPPGEPGGWLPPDPRQPRRVGIDGRGHSQLAIIARQT